MKNFSAALRKLTARLPMSRPAVGLDCGSYAIKLVRAEAKPLKITSALFASISATGAHGEIKKQLAEKKLSNQFAALSMPDEKVESYSMHLPKLPPKELDSAISWEVKKMVASPEFAYSDAVRFEDESGFDVQYVVSSKDVVKGRYDEGLASGVLPQTLETESSAVLGALETLYPEEAKEPAAIIDLGYSAFRFIFAHNGRVSFTRSLFFGVSSLCEQVGGELNYLPKDVISMISQLPPPDAAGAKAANVPPVLERFVQEIFYSLREEFRRSEVFVRDEVRLPDVRRVFLCGGGACFPMTLETVRRHLMDREVKLLDVFEKSPVPTGMDKASGPAWACALGLALRGSK